MIEFSSEEPAPLLLRYPIMAVFAASMRAQTLVGGCDFDSALRMHQAGDLAAAAAGYNDCLAADPGRVDARSNLGAVLVKMGRYRDAIGQYLEALKTASPAALTVLHFTVTISGADHFHQLAHSGDITTLRDEIVGAR